MSFSETALTALPCLDGPGLALTALALEPGSAVILGQIAQRPTLWNPLDFCLDGPWRLTLWNPLESCLFQKPRLTLWNPLDFSLDGPGPFKGLPFERVTLTF